MAEHDDEDLAAATANFTISPHSKPSTAEKPVPKKCSSFLNYPFEIRAMVYEVFFAADICESGKGGQNPGQLPSKEEGSMLVMQSDGHDEDWEDVEEGASGKDIIQTERRMTAHNKVSLLLANKAVLAEASSFFYRLHEFQLLVLGQGEDILADSSHLPCHIQQVVGAIAKVTLVNLDTEDTDEEKLFYCIVDCYIAFTGRVFTNLRSLTVDFELMEYDDPTNGIHELQQLWPRLGYLQLNIEYPYSKRVENILRLIAPGLKWSHYPEDNHRSIDSEGQRMSQRRVFYLDRAHLEKGVTEIEDEDPLYEDTDDYIEGRDYDDEWGDLIRND